MRSLEQRRTGRIREPYPEGIGPFALVGAYRRTIKDFPLVVGATQSDGNTTSNDGDGGPNEEFDWLKDD